MIILEGNNNNIKANSHVTCGVFAQLAQIGS